MSCYLLQLSRSKRSLPSPLTKIQPHHVDCRTTEWKEQLQHSQRRLQQLVFVASRSRDTLPKDFNQFHAVIGSIINVGSKKIDIILFGNGNVGKSSVANSLLGKKVFWPVCEARMTGRLCKTHYGDSDEYLIDGEEIRQAMTLGRKPITPCQQEHGPAG